MTRFRDGELRSAVNDLVRATTSALEDLDKEIDMLRYAVRIQLAGIDPARYVRFAMLAPHISISVGGNVSTYPGAGAFHYTVENYDFCELFVIDSALRLAGSDFKLWMPTTLGDAKRATEEAMAANGGRLPDDFEQMVRPSAIRWVSVEIGHDQLSRVERERTSLPLTAAALDRGA